VGSNLIDLTFKRDGAFLLVRATGGNVKLSGNRGGESRNDELRIPLPGVEVGIPHDLPLPGSRTTQLKVLSQTTDAHSLTLALEAQGSSTYNLPLRVNGVRSAVRVDGGSLTQGAAGRSELNSLRVVFPAAVGYQQQTVRVTW
jgi:hypothetical protein